MEQTVEHIWHEWKTVKLLGEGSFGKVYEIARNRFDIEERSAVKIISIPTSFAEVQALANDGMTEENITAYYRGIVKEFANEIAMMSKLRGHANIVSYEDYEVVERQDRFGWDIYIRMELLTPLPTYLKEHPIEVDTAVCIVSDICCALELCHQRHIVHRDIKPDNIFVSEDGTFKLGDFGVARTIDKTMSGLSKKGTYTYMAPEIYKGELGGTNADIYSLGIVLYRLLNDHREPFLPPYPTEIQYEHKLQALNRRINGESLTPPKYGSPTLHSVIFKACEHSPAKRYQTPTEFKTDLQAALSVIEKPAIATDDSVNQTIVVTPTSSTANDSSYHMETIDPPSTPTESQPTPPLKTKKRRKWLILILALLPIIIGGSFFMTYLYHTNWRDTLNIPANIAVGDTITFGAYEQDGNKFNGKEPVEWIVLSKDSSTLQIISKYALHLTNNEDSYNDHQQWMKTTFCDEAFSRSERLHFDSSETRSLTKSEYETYSDSLSLNCNATAFAKENARGNVGSYSSYDAWYLQPSHEGNVLNIAIQDGYVIQDTSIYSVIAPTGIQDFYLRPVVTLHVDGLGNTDTPKAEPSSPHKNSNRSMPDLSAMIADNLESGSVFLGNAMYWPTADCSNVVTMFGSDHRGIDIADSECYDTQVNAAADGKVLFSGNLNADYGNTVIIGHGATTDGISIISVYAHCNELFVSTDDNIIGGQTIATVGESGDAAEPMLHLEIWEDAVPVDPIEKGYVAYAPIAEESL